VELELLHMKVVASGKNTCIFLTMKLYNCVSQACRLILWTRNEYLLRESVWIFRLCKVCFKL